MTLDLHLYENGKMGKLLFQVNDQAYNDLFPAFELFRERTGYFIDPYRDLVLDSALPALINVLSEFDACPELCDVLEACHGDSQSVIFVGD